uniref:Intraflagellar transport protein 80 homolog n=1 Tax=Cacopsylla melanoneura TaxID=428564 RepID=A0A8D9EYB4_9HEMI
MKFKIAVTKHPDQTEVMSCVDWNGLDELFSCSDDHLVLKWNLVNKDSIKFCELPSEVSPIDFHVYSKSQGTLGVKKSGTGHDLLLTSADGRFHLISKTGRLEKSVESHNGATLVGRWSHDGAGILTGKLYTNTTCTTISQSPCMN